MNSGQIRSELAAFLAEYVTDHKKRLFEKALASRTRRVSAALDRIEDKHDVNAVLRSCECLGVQDVHVITGDGAFSTSKGVAVGSSKWLTLRRYLDADSLWQAASRRGGRLIGMTGDPRAATIEETPLDRPVILCFGSEGRGLSPELGRRVDGWARIPSRGFGSRLNLSVCAATALQTISRRLRANVDDWRLSEREREDLWMIWCARVPKRRRMLTQRFLEDRGLQASALRSPVLDAELVRMILPEPEWPERAADRMDGGGS